MSGRVLELLPAALHGRIANAFALMGVAEDELALARRRHRRAIRSAVFDRAFLTLCAPPQMITLAAQVYRAHARELLDRLGLEGEAADLRPATEAECLIACLEMSLKAPPRAQMAATIDRLWLHVWGHAVPGEPAREPYPHAIDELVKDLRRRLATSTRKLGPAYDSPVPSSASRP